MSSNSDAKTPISTPLTKSRSVLPRQSSASRGNSANITLEIDGDKVDTSDLLAEPSKVSTLSEKARMEALQQLQALQAQMNSLMSALK
jgi:hypothetical protein